MDIWCMLHGVIGLGHKTVEKYFPGMRYSTNENTK